MTEVTATQKLYSERNGEDIFKIYVVSAQLPAEEKHSHNKRETISYI